MLRLFFCVLVVSGAVATVLATACCSGGGPASLSLEWSTGEYAAATVAPSEAVKSTLIVRNDGGSHLDAVTLRFNQNQAGQLPYGISVGTVTNVSSRFEGEYQVWDLGPIAAGDSLAFPLTLWFEAASRTAEPLAVRLVMVATSPELPGQVESNLFEVKVDTRQAHGR